MTASTAPSATRLPRQVVRQSAAIAARYAPAVDETGAPNPADATTAPAPAPAAAPATTSETPAPAADPRESDPNYWKQRFNVTSGILAKERKDRQDERSELLRKNTELQTQATSSKAATVSDADIDLTQFYTPAQIEQYGEEQCRVMAKTAMDAAQATAQKLIDAAVRPLREEREREAADKVTSRKQAFTDKLIELVPDYQAIDVDPRWSDEDTGWLAQEDENGVQRQQLLNIHIGNFDAKKVAKMFEQFRRTITAAPPPVPPMGPSGSGAAPAGDGRPPEGAAGLTAPNDTEVKDFYKRSAIGKVKDEERIAFEARMKLRNPRA